MRLNKVKIIRLIFLLDFIILDSVMSVKHIFPSLPTDALKTKAECTTAAHTQTG